MKDTRNAFAEPRIGPTHEKVLRYHLMDLIPLRKNADASRKQAADIFSRRAFEEQYDRLTEVYDALYVALQTLGVPYEDLPPDRDSEGRVL